MRVVISTIVCIVVITRMFMIVVIVIVNRRFWFAFGHQTGHAVSGSECKVRRLGLVLASGLSWSSMDQGLIVGVGLSCFGRVAV